MAQYINTTKRPLPVNPSNGNSFVIPPKGKATISADQEGSASITSLVNKGFLKRLAEPEAVKEEPAVEILVPITPVVATTKKITDLEKIVEKDVSLEKKKKSL